MRSRQIEPRQMHIAGFDMTLLRTRRKTLSLEVSNTGIKVRAPLRMAQRDIVDFVGSKLSWLQRQVESLPDKVEPLKLHHGATVQLLGYPSQISLSEGRKPVSKQGSTIHVPIVRSKLPPEESTRRKLVNWLRGEARRVIEDQVAILVPAMHPDLGLPTVTIRDYKRRWGSCDQKGDLSFNWRIVQAPLEIIRYLVVHELAHREVFNHSKKFWRLVAEHDPNWQAHQRWLHEHGAQLYRF